MAQHIQIYPNSKNKAEEKIAASILNNFKRGLAYIKGSLKYEQLSGIYSDSGIENELVFITKRSIPKGWIFGSTTGSFEVHYNNILKTVVKIYLVA